MWNFLFTFSDVSVETNAAAKRHLFHWRATARKVIQDVPIARSVRRSKAKGWLRNDARLLIVGHCVRSAMFHRPTMLQFVTVTQGLYVIIQRLPLVSVFLTASAYVPATRAVAMPSAAVLLCLTHCPLLIRTPLSLERRLTKGRHIRGWPHRAPAEIGCGDPVANE